MKASNALVAVVDFFSSALAHATAHAEEVTKQRDQIVEQLRSIEVPTAREGEKDRLVQKLRERIDLIRSDLPSDQATISCVEIVRFLDDYQGRQSRS